MIASESWMTEIRKVFYDSFADDWETHVAGLNKQYGLSAQGQLSVHVPGAPLWFIGDVEAIRPGAWALAISLNPHTPPADLYESGRAPEFYWNLWRTHHRDPEFWKKTQIYGRLARVAATALGEPLSQDRGQRQRFATERMVFTNLCPYASESFALQPSQVSDLVANDRGFRTMAKINRLLIEQAQPAVVLVNGERSMDEMAAAYGLGLRWNEYTYQSVRVQEKILRHWQGVLELESGPVPIAGFKMIGKPGRHHWNDEIDQLGQLIREKMST